MPGQGDTGGYMVQECMVHTGMHRLRGRRDGGGASHYNEVRGCLHDICGVHGTPVLRASHAWFMVRYAGAVHGAGLRPLLHCVQDYRANGVGLHPR